MNKDIKISKVMTLASKYFKIQSEYANNKRSYVYM